MSRRALLILLMVTAGILVLLLMLNVQESRIFRIGQPAEGPTAAYPTTISLSTGVSATVTGVIQHPRYTGRSTQGERWEISATTATQLAETSADGPVANSGELDLQHPSAQWRTGSGGAETSLRVQAERAWFNVSNSQLVLPEGAVTEGQWSGGRFFLTAGHAEANLGISSLVFSQGVSATFVPTPTP